MPGGGYFSCTLAFTSPLVTPYVRVFYYCLIDLYQFTPFRELYAQKVSFGGNQTMRTFVTLVFLAFTLFAIPVQGDKYLTEAQKELLLEQSRTLGLDKEKEHAQNASEQSDQTNFVKQQSRPVKSRPTAPVVNNARTQTQILQSKPRNTGRSYSTYGNRPVKQSRQVAKTAPNYQSIKRSRQVSKTARKKTNWSGFFKNLSLIAGGINSGMNQTNSQQQSQQFYQQQLRQVQQNNNALMRYNNQQNNSWGQNSFKKKNNVNRVYSPEECLGSVVNGQCLGVISPKPPNTYCYGTVINGRCVGTVK
jgi:hypothetical protein